MIERAYPQARAPLVELQEGLRKFQSAYSIGFTLVDCESRAQQGATVIEEIQIGLTWMQVSYASRRPSREPHRSYQPPAPT